MPSQGMLDSRTIEVAAFVEPLAVSVHGNDGPTSQTDFFVDSLLVRLSNMP